MKSSTGRVPAQREREGGKERQSRPRANIHLRLSSPALSHGEPLHRLSVSGQLRQEAGDNREAPQEEKKSA